MPGHFIGTTCGVANSKQARQQKEAPCRTFRRGTGGHSGSTAIPRPRPPHYPLHGSGQSRYRLHQVGRQGDRIVYAVYGAPDSADADVLAIADERDYARRFEAEPETVTR